MPRPVNGGLYYVRNIGSGTRMDLNNGSWDNGTKVQGWEGGDSENQRWTVRFAENSSGVDWFFLECRASMTRLDLNNGSNRNGTRCQGWDPSWTDNQMWRFIDEGNDRYRIRNRSSGTDLDLNNGDRRNGTQIQGWDQGNVDAQRWVFEDVDQSDYLSYGEGNYELFNFGAKIVRCSHMIDLSKSDRNPKHCYGTAFNMSRFGVYNPIDAQSGMGGDIERLLSPDNIGRDGQYRIGGISFDFYERNLGAVQNVIRSNRGCGGL